MKEEKKYTMEEIYAAYQKGMKEGSGYNWLTVFKALTKPKPIKFDLDVEWYKRECCGREIFTFYNKDEQIFDFTTLVGKKGKLTFEEHVE